MDKLIDLHTHSTASDGSMKPQELVRHAKRCGLAAIAITDHDTIDGIEEAVKEGLCLGVEVIPGLEISVDFNPEMHILGYFPGEAYLKIKNTLVSLKRNRDERNPKIINRLNELGFDISMEEVEKEAHGAITGRVHIAKVLADKGYVANVEEAFKKLLLSGRPAYFKKEKLTPGQGIREIICAGGAAVLAHPIYLHKDIEELDGIVYELKTAGLTGIEAYYVDNTPEETRDLLNLAGKHKLLVTGGSDFHGRFKPDIEIGIGRGNLNIPYGLLENLKGLLVS